MKPLSCTVPSFFPIRSGALVRLGFHQERDHQRQEDGDQSAREAEGIDHGPPMSFRCQTRWHLAAWIPSHLGAGDERMMGMNPKNIEMLYMAFSIPRWLN